jgi:hypothetical protein
MPINNFHGHPYPRGLGPYLLDPSLPGDKLMNTVINTKKKNQTAPIPKAKSSE